MWAQPTLGLKQGERFVDQLLSLIQALVGQAGVMRALGILDEDEIPVELALAVEGVLHGRGQRGLELQQVDDEDPVRTGNDGDVGLPPKPA